MNPALHFMATSCFNDGAVTGILLAAFALVAAGLHPLIVCCPSPSAPGSSPRSFMPARLAVVAALLPRRETADLDSRAACGPGAGALLVGSFWYLRNWSCITPIYPMGRTA